MTIRAATAVFYPETDGKPLPDGEYQAPIYINTVTPLRIHFAGVPGARVNGNTLLYYVEGDPRRVVSPDCYVAFGLTEEALHSLSLEGNNTYLLWEVGKAPDFVLEIGSGSTARVDLGSKRDLYAELGVREYWRYDATGGEFYGEPLVGERLVDGEYVRMELVSEDEGRIWSRSEVLGLELWWIEGALRYWQPAERRWLLRPEEEHEARIAAEARAAAERQARLDAEAEHARLRAKLREPGH